MLLILFRSIFQPGQSFALEGSRPRTYVKSSDLHQTVTKSVRGRAINYLHRDFVWIFVVPACNVGMYLKLWHEQFLPNSLNTNLCHLSNHWTLYSEPLRVSINKKIRKERKKQMDEWMKKEKMRVNK
jgi:hypothetical protein